MRGKLGVHLLGLLALTMPILAACSSQDSNTSERIAETQAVEQPALGAEIYAQYCAACHGPNGEGQRPDAPLQKDETGHFPAPPHDDTGHTWHHDDDLLIQIIKVGGMGNSEDFYEMPAFGDVLNEQEREAVLAFIKTMWTDEQRTTQQMRTEAVRSGR